MFKTPRNYKFEKLTADTTTIQEEKIGVADLLRISISPNDGFSKVNFTMEATQAATAREFLELMVSNDGKLKLPLIGHVSVLGKTARELETDIEGLYQNYYVKPFVTVQVMNRRIIVFQGNGGIGRSIQLVDYNTTLFEVLAQAGGIFEDGKAYKIKLIRNINNTTKIYLVDLSTISGIPEGNMLVLPNDIIYVEPRMRFAQRFITELTPFLTLLSTSLILFSLLSK